MNSNKIKDLLNLSLKNKDFLMLKEPAKDFNSFPLFIPSYLLKRRDNGHILMNLDKIHRKIYIVVYDFDYEKSGYDKLKLPPNAEFVILKDHPTDCKVPSAEYKASQTVKFAFEHGIKAYFKFDDDVLINGSYVSSEYSESGKTRKRPQIDIDTLMNIEEMTVSAYDDWGMILISFSRTELLTYNFTEILSNKTSNPTGGIYLFNVDVYKRKPELFSPYRMIGGHEDICLCGAAMEVGLQCYRERRFCVNLIDKAFSVCNNQDVFVSNKKAIFSGRFFDYKIPFKKGKNNFINLNFRPFRLGKKIDVEKNKKFAEEFLLAKTLDEQIYIFEKHQLK